MKKKSHQLHNQNLHIHSHLKKKMINKIYRKNKKKIHYVLIEWVRILNNVLLIFYRLQKINQYQLPTRNHKNLMILMVIKKILIK